MNVSSEKINVLCATDDKYAPYCGIMLTSLFECNKDCRFIVFVFVDGCFSEANHKKFKKLEQRYDCEVNLVTIDDRLLEKCPVNKQRNVGNHEWVSKPTYYRLLSSEILPEEIQKVIYLDCDIAVVGDIKPLWNTDISGKAMAGVVDCDEEKNRIRLGLPSQYTYVNAGMALYNLEYWRQHSISTRFFEFIREHEEELLLMDQDVVNGVLCDKMILVSERYNFQVAFFVKRFWKSYPEDFRQRLLKENKEISIVHYVGEMKPWDFKYYGFPYYEIWNKNRKKSFWKQSHITSPFGSYIRFLLKRVLCSTSLKRKRQSIWVVIPENKFCFA